KHDFALLVRGSLIQQSQCFSNAACIGFRAGLSSDLPCWRGGCSCTELAAIIPVGGQCGKVRGCERLYQIVLMVAIEWQCAGEQLGAVAMGGKELFDTLRQRVNGTAGQDALDAAGEQAAIGIAKLESGCRGLLRRAGCAVRSHGMN